MAGLLLNSIHVQLIVWLTVLLSLSAAHEDHNMHDKDHAQDAEHIKEHYEGVADIDTSSMTPEQLEWHFFKLHDYNNDSRLDGLEMLTAISHHNHRGEDDTKLTVQEIHEKVATELEQSEVAIELFFGKADVDEDGYITYPEWVESRKH